MTDIHPRLVELYRNEVALCWGPEQKFGSDNQLEEAMRNLAQGFCASILSSYKCPGEFFIVAGPEDFPDSVWGAVQARFCSSDRDTDEMRLLLWRQFQAWAADPKFRVPGGVLTIDDDRRTVIVRTGPSFPNEQVGFHAEPRCRFVHFGA